MMDSLKINTIIIEDHKDAQEYLTNLINKNFNSIQINGYADTVVDAVNLIHKQKPELIFMDIELKDGHSFEVFDQLSYHDFEVVFVTAFEGFIQKALDHYALSYLTKPIDVEKLIATINRYIDRKERLYHRYKFELLSSLLQAKEAKIMIHTGSEYVSIKIDEILKCIASGNYTEFYLSTDKMYVASKNLKYYENLLTKKGFFKANRSTMINISFILSIYKKETIILKNKDRVNVSVRNKAHLTSLINELS